METSRPKNTMACYIVGNELSTPFDALESISTLQVTEVLQLLAFLACTSPDVTPGKDMISEEISLNSRQIHNAVYRHYYKEVVLLYYLRLFGFTSE